MILIPEPYIPTQHDITERALFIMKSNVRRMEYMIECGYYVSKYSDEEWEKFKTKQRWVKQNQMGDIP